MRKNRSCLVSLLPPPRERLDTTPGRTWLRRVNDEGRSDSYIKAKVERWRGPGRLKVTPGGGTERRGRRGSEAVRRAWRRCASRSRTPARPDQESATASVCASWVGIVERFLVVLALGQASQLVTVDARRLAMSGTGSDREVPGLWGNWTHQT